MRRGIGVVVAIVGLVLVGTGLWMAGGALGEMYTANLEDALSGPAGGEAAMGRRMLQGAAVMALGVIPASVGMWLAVGRGKRRSGKRGWGAAG
ncbi:MAG: hypothetical protein ACK51N_00440 [bacterium]|jgi:hypothetical protein|nr:hypothetical protein [Phycisphaerales bacterium]MCE2654227.1 hypothetical protein [Planctomycetaceae bacterium]